MYIEFKSSKNFLVKKVAQKKISTQIVSDGLTEKVLMNLTQKEFSLISEQEEYKNFEQLLYNKPLLKDIVLSSKLLINTMQVAEM
jgi:hypothetical protein